jgi:tRNA threonylcarbamoyladenosine biosynthesis protein TsaB
MRILAIEASGQAGSVAALKGLEAGVELVREAAVGVGARTAQALGPLTKELLTAVDWPTDSIELVVVSVGPGSFTGLRIGVTMAKTFAYAVGAQVIGVNTLEVVAAQTAQADGTLWTVMDAQRQELFVAKFLPAGDGSQRMKMVDETRIQSQAQWLAALKSGDTVTGPGLRRLAEPVPTGVTMVDESQWQPMATAVGRVAWQDFQTGRRDDVWKLMPAYYRASAAEEKLRR